MKSKILKIFLIILFSKLIFINSYSNDQFNFDVTEIEILENGNLVKGYKRGKIETNEGIIINADEFEYNKALNILLGKGNVVVKDLVNNYFITAEKITYFKNLEKIEAENNVTAEDKTNNYIITAEKITYFKNLEKVEAENNVTAEDKTNNYIISAEKITYLKNLEKVEANKNVRALDKKNDYLLIAEDLIYDKKKNQIITQGKTTAKIQNKYEIKSSNVFFLINENKLYSKYKTIIKDTNLQVYNLDKFVYFIEKELLKGENIIAISNYGLPNSDKIFFSNAEFNLKNKSFIGKDVKVNINKNIFGDPNNDPRIVGISAKGESEITKINKGVFTSCGKNDNCPPWSINAEEILHDKRKKEIIYNHAWLKLYDIPILYFPKFFHPDPTVERRSGFLKPQFNNSNVLGSSYSIPYFSVLAENKDFTFTPSIFENNLQMLQNEYRGINRNSKFTANFGYVNNYKSSLSSNKNSIFNLFSKYELDLNFENFKNSELFVSIEKVSNDTFLKVFDTNIQDTDLKPKDFNNLNSEIKVFLDHEKYTFDSGIQSYENLQKKSSDRYEYVFPYYNFNTSLSENFWNGSVSLSSSGNNVLNNTNKLKSNITNDVAYLGSDFISRYGFKNNISIDIKNLNSLGKNNSEYKSSPQIELMSLIDLSTSLPLTKEEEAFNNYLTPKMSLKFNPSDMKNYSDSDRKINTNNIFSNNRLGLTDSLESGRSLTIGLDYRREKKERIDDINRFFEAKLATVIRDKEEKFIPKKSTLNKKASNLFGSVKNNFSDIIELEYNFSIDNDYKTFEYNDFSAQFDLENFTTKFSFIEENGEIGDSNFIENSTSFNFENSNYITFKTRRNRKLNLTEYYDLVYEYKNDCLTAGIKYKKTYYEDRDLKPSENLFFTVTLIPLTTYEQKVER